MNTKLIIYFFCLLPFFNTSYAQDWGPRSLDELKKETLRRAANNLNPITGILMEDAERAMSKFNSPDKDLWASIWMDNGDYWMESAKKSSGIDAELDYYLAWRNYNVGRWPTEKHSDGKKLSYEKGIKAFLKYGELLEPSVERVVIPFEDSHIIAYLRIPSSNNPVPLIFALNGLDSRKEDIIAGTDNYIKNGIAVFAMDMPGTGESPVLIDIGSERVFSVALDYLETRKEIDSNNIAVQGRSWSGYWAALLAYIEKDRIKGSAVHGVQVHGYFQPDWQRKALLSEEYLFDLFPARSVVYNTNNMEDFLAYGPRLSLIDRGYIDQASAPMLLVNGHQDSQQPISDLYLLMENGDPKDVWVNPIGGHLGRSEIWTMRKILNEVVEPWLMRKVGVEPLK
ncbi:MAG: alpha/beta hydrolase [Pseudomonadota bacterium]|nr:alpha/beta hydrolase [Pseudomonadota bacterium]|tara:strand:- start:738 stop:1928 length:1191 start_codon:yes stop_codon:yes gene_type:complete